MPPGRPTTIKRRTLLKAGVAGAAWLAGAPYASTARSAGELSVLLWHHWVPGANEAIQTVIEEGCALLGMTARVDFFSGAGRRNIEQIAREAREGSGHDLVDLPSPMPFHVRESLEPLDDLIAELIRRHGPPLQAAMQAGRIDGVWRAAPGPYGNSTYPQAARLDHWRKHAGIDLRMLFPAHERRDLAAVAGWTWDAYLVAARKLHAAGHPVGHPIGLVSDANDWLGPLFLSFGSVLVDDKGNVTIDSDATRQALEFVVRLGEVMPADVFDWDDAGNNRHLASGRGSAIFNPPSAWAWARKNRPEVAGQIWHHDVPAGPAGRYRGSIPRNMGVWRFARNKQAAREIILYLWEPAAQRRLLQGAQGYDIPQFSRYNDHPVWRTADPPSGVLYNYPVRGDEQVIHTGYPASPMIETAIYHSYLLPSLVTRVARGGESFNQAIEWAQRELESYRG